MLTGCGKLTVKIAQTAEEIAAVMALRRARFGVGEDAFDQGAILVMIGRAGGAIEGCFRLTVFDHPQDIAKSYSAQFYDLSNLSNLAGPWVELGRFCMVAGGGADLLRLAFAMMARVVDHHGAGVLFGCASFIGADLGRHEPALAVLRQHRAPQGLEILKKSRHAFDFARLSDRPTAEGLRDVPPLLRSYLALGGWVSDHAVQDFELDTLHVFTAVEIAKIPSARAAALRQLAQDCRL